MARKSYVACLIFKQSILERDLNPLIERECQKLVYKWKGINKQNSNFAIYEVIGLTFSQNLVVIFIHLSEEARICYLKHVAKNKCAVRLQ